MKTMFAVACVAACCMGNLPLPGECHGQLSNAKTAISSHENDAEDTSSNHARWCGDREDSHKARSVSVRHGTKAV